MARLNLTPGDLTHITNSMDSMKRALDDAAHRLKTDTNSIQSKWSDDQFEVFKDTMEQFYRRLNEMSSILEKEKNRVKKLPFVTAKIAVSKNKLIYSKGTQRITGKDSDKFTHYLRYKNDSIMISSKTLNIDNPKLNCRLKGYDKFSPKRIILDKDLEIKFNSNIVLISESSFSSLCFMNNINWT